MKLKPISKIGKDEPKGWEITPDHYPITLEPQDENELPVPFYDSDDYCESDAEVSDNGHTTCDESDSDYMSDTSTCSGINIKKFRIYNRVAQPPQVFKTVVAKEIDFLEE